MERFPVNSTALYSVGYNEKLKILELEFRENGGVWQYLKFSKNKYKEFLQSESLGSFFVKKIKGKYREMKVNG